MRSIGIGEGVEDGFAKVTGRKKYTEDEPVLGMLYGDILFSPIAHGNIKNIDVREAEALPGVHCVITYKDSPDVKFNRIMRFIDDDLPATEKVLDKRVRYVGDQVAAVAAESRAIAKKALKLIKVEYEELEAVFDVEEAAKDNFIIYDDLKSNVIERLSKSCGNLEAGFNEADFIVEHCVKTPILHHGAIEPYLVIADWTTDELHLKGPQQGVYSAQIMLSKIFGLPYHKIKITNTVIGGTFGGKEGLILEPIAAMLSKKSGKPVIIRLDREASIVSTTTRHSSVIYSKLGVRKDGIMTAYTTKVYLNGGAYCASTLNILGAMCGKLFKLYKMPNIAFDGYPTYTNLPVASAMRGFGSPQLFASLELLVDKAANAIGMDPCDIRKKNVVKAYDIDPLAGLDLGNANIDRCIESGKIAIGWDEKIKEIRKSDNEYYRGLGMAVSLHGNGVAPFAPDISVMTLALNEDGSAIFSTSLCDHGGGTNTLLKKIVNEIVDIDISLIKLVTTDTHNAPYDFIAGASRNTWVGGNCAIELCKKMKEELLECASIMFKVKKEAIVMRDECFVSKDGKAIATRKEVIYYGLFHLKKKFIITNRYASKTNAGSYGAHFASVKIHKVTGKVSILDYVAVCDVGRALNPILLEGQIHGAIQMGIGMALSEELLIDENGKILNSTFEKYKMPKAKDMPASIKILFVEDKEPGGPFGGKSIGEASVNPVAPAIINAVNNALSCEFTKFPVTNEMIMKRLRNM